MSLFANQIKNIYQGEPHRFALMFLAAFPVTLDAPATLSAFFVFD